jgi:predicted kinase
VARLAREAGAQFACLEFDLPDEVIRKRLVDRMRKGGDASDARPAILAAQKRRYQRPAEIDAARRIAAPASGSAEAKVRAVLKGLRAVSPLLVGGQGRLAAGGAVAAGVTRGGA